MWKIVLVLLATALFILMARLSYERPFFDTTNWLRGQCYPGLDVCRGEGLTSVLANR